MTSTKEACAHSPLSPYLSVHWQRFGSACNSGSRLMPALKRLHDSSSMPQFHMRAALVALSTLSRSIAMVWCSRMSIKPALLIMPTSQQSQPEHASVLSTVPVHAAKGLSVNLPAGGLQPGAPGTAASPAQQARGGWTEHTAPTGRKYWHNATTKKSVWERPPEFQAAEVCPACTCRPSLV